MKKLFTLCFHVILYSYPTWWSFRQCHCLLPEIRILWKHYLFTHSTFNLCTTNLNFSFLLWNKLHLYFVIFLLLASILCNVWEKESTNVLWMALFSRVSIFVDWIKIAHSFVTITFSFIIHTKIRYSLGNGICGMDPPRKLVPHEN